MVSSLQTHRRALPVLLAVAGLFSAVPARAQVRVNPTGVNVNTTGATTVFLSYGNVRANLRPAEAFWCGALVSAAPARGNRCDPNTIFGSLPARYDLSRPSGVNGFTDIMSIPASVSRRAYQDARAGATSTFHYVRRFINLSGGPDEYVSVTCRLSAGGARSPFALTDVRVAFDGADEVHFVETGEALPRFSAQIRHTGTGRLVGRWEVVMPGEDAPTANDLLTEATLPLEQRGRQRRYAMVERFNIFVPPGGRVELPGPDPARLPTATEGTYLVLLRVEATDDREGDSNLQAAGAGTALVHSAAVAGFPMPVLRYVVFGDGSSDAGDGRSRLTALSRDGMRTKADSTARLDWSPDPRASFYRLEVETPDGQAIHGALLRAATPHYTLPALAWQRDATATALRWRVTALDANGRFLRRTGWRRVQLVPAP